MFVNFLKLSVKFGIFVCVCLFFERGFNLKLFNIKSLVYIVFFDIIFFIVVRFGGFCVVYLLWCDVCVFLKVCFLFLLDWKLLKVEVILFYSFSNFWDLIYVLGIRGGGVLVVVF